ncbi:MAG: hypothetical protein AAF939_06670 [Planctomycetota bacterium]
MLYEIVSTQADRGVLRGTSGFCPVAVTEDIPKAFVKPLFSIARRQVKEADGLRPKSKYFYSHFPFSVDGKKLQILTRGTRLSKNNYLVHQMYALGETGGRRNSRDLRSKNVAK